MSEIVEFKSLMHTFHCQGRAIEKLKAIIIEIDDLNELESFRCANLRNISDHLKVVLSYIEYKW